MYRFGFPVFIHLLPKWVSVIDLLVCRYKGSNHQLVILHTHTHTHTHTHCDFELHICSSIKLQRPLFFFWKSQQGACMNPQSVSQLPWVVGAHFFFLSPSG